MNKRNQDPQSAANSALGMEYEDMERQLNSYLLLTHHVVGVKLYSEAETFACVNAKQHKHRSYYCQMIKLAANGKLRKSDVGNFACETSAKVLGLEAFYEEEEGINGWFDSGLYADRQLAEAEHSTVRPVPRDMAGIVTGPLSKLQGRPDVVILICNPYQAMRVVQGYTYHYGFKKDFMFSGMCGVCFESTALPSTQQTFSISLLCSGTRFICKWPDDLMMVSFPYSIAERILDGIIQTAQPCEPNSKKDVIKHRLLHHHIPEKEPLKHNKAYFYRKP